MSTLVLDVGGTKISSAIADDLGLREVETVPSEKNVLATVEKIIHNRISTQTTAISIGWAGWVTRDGVIACSPHLPVQNFDVRAHFKKFTTLPVHIDNDANLFALAETHRRHEDTTVLGIPIGTGIGAGLVHHGQIFRGAKNFSGEIGHQQIGALRAEQWFAGVSPDLPGHVDERLGMFGEWLSNLAFAFDPAAIVLGGSVGMKIWQPHLEQLQQILDHQYREFPASPRLACTDDPHAVLHGAALAAKI